MLGLQWPLGVGAFPKPQLTTRAQPCPPSPTSTPPVVSEAGESGLVTVAGADDHVLAEVPAKASVLVLAPTDSQQGLHEVSGGVTLAEAEGELSK